MIEVQHSNVRAGFLVGVLRRWTEKHNHSKGIQCNGKWMYAFFGSASVTNIKTQMVIVLHNLHSMQNIKKGFWFSYHKYIKPFLN